MNLEFHKATLEDSLYIADNLRPNDLKECTTLSNKDVRITLQSAWENSSHAWTVKTAEGTPVAILGLVPAPGANDTGIPWLLCTDLADTMPKAFAKYAPEYVSIFHAIYPKLFNVVPTTSTKTLAWLKRLGFSFGEPILSPLMNGVQITPFFRTQPNV